MSLTGNHEVVVGQLVPNSIQSFLSSILFIEVHSALSVVVPFSYSYERTGFSITFLVLLCFSTIDNTDEESSNLFNDSKFINQHEPTRSKTNRSIQSATMTL